MKMCNFLIQIVCGFIGSILAGVLISKIFERRANKQQEALINNFLKPIKKIVNSIAEDIKKIPDIATGIENIAKKIADLSKILREK